MMIFGRKYIQLKNIEINHPCSACGCAQQILFIFRKFLTFFYIPIFPLRKKSIVYCTGCGAENTKENLLKRLSDKGNDVGETEKLLNTIVKEARVPIYTYFTVAITISLFFSFIGYIYHTERQSAAATAAYYDSPIENVLVISRDDEMAYPYQILYIPQLSNGKAVVFEWLYAYKELREAKGDIDTVIRTITSHSVPRNFSEPVLIPISVVLKLNLDYVKPLPFSIDLESLISKWPRDETP